MTLFGTTYAGGGGGINGYSNQKFHQPNYNISFTGSNGGGGTGTIGLQSGGYITYAGNGTNTLGGGGGGGTSNSDPSPIGGCGGSGTVIVRYYA